MPLIELHHQNLKVVTALASATGTLTFGGAAGTSATTFATGSLTFGGRVINGRDITFGASLQAVLGATVRSQLSAAVVDPLKADLTAGPGQEDLVVTTTTETVEWTGRLEHPYLHAKIVARYSAEIQQAATKSRIVNHPLKVEEFAFDLELQPAAV